MSVSQTAPSHTTSTPSLWRSAGIWMSLMLVIYMFFNAARAVLNPADFGFSYGLPNPNVNALVIVYAIRALFLGLFGAGLLIRRHYLALALYAYVAAVMPLGDALLVAAEGGAAGTVVRHLLTAVFLLATGYLVRRWTLKREAHA